MSVGEVGYPRGLYGMSRWEGILRGVRYACDVPTPSICGQADTCENITLP